MRDMRIQVDRLVTQSQAVTGQPANGEIRRECTSGEKPKTTFSIAAITIFHTTSDQVFTKREKTFLLSNKVYRHWLEQGVVKKISTIRYVRSAISIFFVVFPSNLNGKMNRIKVARVKAKSLSVNTRLSKQLLRKIC